MQEIDALPQQEMRAPLARLTPAQVKADYNLVLQAMGACMEVGKDYGIIPGTFKPTLYKPGAEKLSLIFKLAGKPIIEDLSTSEEIRYRVATEIMHTPSNTIVGYGVGEASTNEEKYKWRKASCQEEWEDTMEDRRRKKWSMGKEGKAYTIAQVRTNPADLANTILKMADKRALIGGILKVTAASSIFSQDLEDMDKDVREAVAHADEGTMPPPIPDPQRKSAQPPVTPPVAATAATAPAAAKPNDGGEPPPEKAKTPEHFRAMASKIEGGTCTTCGGPIGKGDPIYFDVNAKRAHHRSHFA